MVGLDGEFLVADEFVSGKFTISIKYPPPPTL